MHSAFDLSPEMHDFASWLTEERFFGHKTGSEDLSLNTPAIELTSPVAFANYNSMYAGVGLKSLKSIQQDEVLIKMKMQMGFSSRNLVDNSKSEPQEEQNLIQEITDHTRKVSEKLAPGNLSTQLRLFNHFILTQKLLMISRKTYSSDMKNLSMDANLLSGYMSALPGKDLSTLPYWDQKTLNEIDSEILRK